MSERIEFTVFKGTEREFTGTKREIAEHFNIPYSTMKQRWNKLKPDIDACVDYTSTRKIYTVFAGTDMEFSGTIRGIETHFGLSGGTLCYRLKTRKSIEDCILGDIKGKVTYTVFENTENEFTGTIIEIIKHFNLKENTIRTRLKRGYTLEEAISVPLYKVVENNLYYKGSRGTMKELCNKFGKDFVKVYNYIKQGKTFEYAMSKGE